MSGAAKRGVVVCLGEVLLRLSSDGGIPLAETNRLAVDVGGAEANVAAALASLGQRARMLTILPGNPLGRMARMKLAAAGVDTSSITEASGRMGVYFYEQPSGPLAGRVTYDRAASAFVQATPDMFDFDSAMETASLLHMSGITPALGPGGLEIARAAITAARKADVPVCFDANYRTHLWDAWDCSPCEILRELVSEASLFIGNHRDISLLLGKTFSGDGPDRRREATEAAFAEFPKLELIASTARHVESGSVHRLAARVDLRSGHWQTGEVRIDGIVDRIGTGDAFAAGMLLRYLEGASTQDIAEAALVLAVMKHGVSGDMILTTRRELDEFNFGGNDVRR